MYKNLVRPILFSFDSEKIHDFSFAGIGFLQLLKITNFIGSINSSAFDPRLKVKVGSLTFPNPVGLAAGFDKQAKGFKFFESLGFGSVEVGTITSRPQPGNPKPRIFRLQEDCAIINRMGFPSEGVEEVLARLKQLKQSTDKKSILGVNIGKAKDIALEDAWADSLALYKQVSPFADYVTINISSPNTPDLRKLQEPKRLEELFRAIKSASSDSAANQLPPVFIKLSPDIEDQDLKAIVEVCKSSGIDGLIATNTTIERPETLLSDASLTQEAGGLSGKPLTEKSLKFVNKLSSYSEKSFPIIGVGGVFTAEDLLAMLKAGASTVQIYTGLIYEGPLIASNICKKLINLLEQTGCKELNQLYS